MLTQSFASTDNVKTLTESDTDMRESITSSMGRVGRLTGTRETVTRMKSIGQATLAKVGVSEADQRYGIYLFVVNPSTTVLTLHEAYRLGFHIPP